LYGTSISLPTPRYEKGRSLAGEASQKAAEAEDLVPQLLTLLVVHQFVAVALLEYVQALLFCGSVRGRASEWIARRRYACGVHSDLL